MDREGGDVPRLGETHLGLGVTTLELGEATLGLGGTTLGLRGTIHGLGGATLRLDWEELHTNCKNPDEYR